MPTYVTTNAGGTPQTRLSSLLESSLSSLDESSPAYASLQEAYKLSTGQEEYLEKMTGDLIVPNTHGAKKEEVEKVWIELLRKTEETDWKRLKEEGKTTWELSVGMVSSCISYQPLARDHGILKRRHAKVTPLDLL